MMVAFIAAAAIAALVAAASPERTGRFLARVERAYRRDLGL
jgi:hypothetical protein